MCNINKGKGLNKNMEVLDKKESKICTKCLVEKSFLEFNKHSQTKDGYNTACKNCSNKQNRERYKKNKERNIDYTIDGEKTCWKCKIKKKYSEFYKSKGRSDGYSTVCRGCNNHVASPEKKRKYDKKRRLNNKEKEKIRHRKYYLNNKEKVDKYRKEWRIKNREYCLKYRVEYNKRKKKNDIRFNLNSKIGSSMARSLKGEKNNRHWETLVNYTIEDLENHLKSLFTEGMTWRHFLDGEIVIDHISPLELFEFESPEDKQFKICWSLENLQPLWEADNLKKSDFLPDKRRARNLTKEEKLEYLRSLGYNF